MLFTLTPLHYQQIVDKQGITTEKAYLGLEPLEQKAAAVLVAHLAPSLDSVSYQLLKRVIKSGFLPTGEPKGQLSKSGRGRRGTCVGS